MLSGVHCAFQALKCCMCRTRPRAAGRHWLLVAVCRAANQHPAWLAANATHRGAAARAGRPDSGPLRLSEQSCAIPACVQAVRGLGAVIVAAAMHWCAAVQLCGCAAVRTRRGDALRECVSVSVWFGGQGLLGHWCFVPCTRHYALKSKQYIHAQPAHSPGGRALAPRTAHAPAHATAMTCSPSLPLHIH